MVIERVQLQHSDGINVPHLSDAVEVLQRHLQNWGVLPMSAKVDGKFGDGTKTAVERFQSLRPADPVKSKFVPTGLQINGVVEHNTWAELEKVFPTEIKMVSRDASAVNMPSGFPHIDTILQVAKVPPVIHPFARQNIPIILNECLNNGVSDLGKIAYILATAEHESHIGRFMTELANGSAYEPDTPLSRVLGNFLPGDGPRFRGRGFVQITGRRNYADWARRTGKDLVNHPEKATIPSIAAVILVVGMMEGTFTGARLGQFIGGLRQDFVNARQVVNNHDKADTIAEMARFYLKAIA